MFVARFAMLAVLVCVSGCDEPSASPPPAAPKPASSPAKPPTTVEADIAWPASVDAEARAALDAEARAAVDRSPVPVLVLKRAPFLAASKVIAEPNYVAVSTQGEGVTVSIQASRIAYKYDHIPPQQGRSRVRGQPAFVTENERIWSASWSELGIAYSLDVECAKLPDPRCENERFVIELAESLAYVGGSGGAR